MARTRFYKCVVIFSTFCVLTTAHADIGQNNQTKFWFKDSIYDSNNNPEEFCTSNKVTYTDIRPTFTGRDITYKDEKSLIWLVKKSDSLKASHLTNRCFMAKFGNQQVLRGVSLSNYSQRLIKGNVLSITDRQSYFELKLTHRY